MARALKNRNRPLAWIAGCKLAAMGHWEPSCWHFFHPAAAVPNPKKFSGAQPLLVTSGDRVPLGEIAPTMAGTWLMQQPKTQDS